MISAVLVFSRIVAMGLLAFSTLALVAGFWTVAMNPGVYVLGNTGRYIVIIFVSVAWLYATWPL